MVGLCDIKHLRRLAVVVGVIATLQSALSYTNAVDHRAIKVGEPKVDVMSLHATAAAGPSPLSGSVMHVLALGDAEAVLLQCGAEAVLIGTGAPWTQQSVIRYVSGVVQGELDAIILLYGDVEHVGGLATILQVVGSDRIFDATPVPAEWLNDPALSGVPAIAGYSRWEAGDRFELQCAEIRALAPISDTTVTAAANPLAAAGGVLLVTSGPGKALLAGRLDAAGETSLLRLYPDLSAEVLVVGRKGHKSASSRLFLERIRPRAAVIPVGVYNEEGRPHPEVLERLQAVGANIYRTDHDGTIVIRFRTNEIEVKRQYDRRQGGWGRNAHTAHQR